MRVLFVVEAGFKAGLGHLLRSRALLLELRGRNHTVDLWLYGDETSLAGRDWPVEMQVFRSPDSEPVSAVPNEIGRLLESRRYDWLVVDGYSFSGHAICGQLVAHGAKLLMLDDLADRELKADIILNQNTAHAEVYAGDLVAATRFLLGPQYALIDNAYAAIRKAPRMRGELRRLLVTFGGVDCYGRTQRVMDIISRYESPLDIVVVVGPYYPYLDRLESWRSRHTLRVVQNARDLAEPMQWCDLMITGGGSTVWQACCAGVPMLVLQTIDNQRLVIKTVREFGAALSLDVSAKPDENAGIAENDFAEVFRQAADAEVRAGLSANAMQLVDGNGASRVADVLESWE